MRKLSFETPDIMDILNHQVIHMDQAVTYCPEYLVTGKMRNYPSRTAQIIRAVYLGELEDSKENADLAFAPILSGQGERWQNFGEKPEGYLLSVILGREMFLKKGYHTQDAEALKEKVEKNDGHYLNCSKEEEEEWKKVLPLSKNSRKGLLLDEATFVYAAKEKEKLGAFLQKKNICVSEEIGPYFTGFDYLAAGLVEEGIKVVKDLIAEWEKQGFHQMITLTGQSQYLFTEMLSYLDLQTDIEFISILDLADDFRIQNDYVYGGSFYTRYAKKAVKLNQLSKAEKETPILNCPEFLPQVEGEKRKNVVGIWTPPLCAQYEAVMTEPEFQKAIYERSLAEIKKTHFKKLVVCDPYAYHMLLENGYGKENVAYYFSVMN